MRRLRFSWQPIERTTAQATRYTGGVEASSAFGPSRRNSCRTGLTAPPTPAPPRPSPSHLLSSDLHEVLGVPFGPAQYRVGQVLVEGRVLEIRGPRGSQPILKHRACSGGTGQAGPSRQCASVRVPCLLVPTPRGTPSFARDSQPTRGAKRGALPTRRARRVSRNKQPANIPFTGPSPASWGGGAASLHPVASRGEEISSLSTRL